MRRHTSLKLGGLSSIKEILSHSFLNRGLPLGDLKSFGLSLKKIRTRLNTQLLVKLAEFRECLSHFGPL